MNVGVLVCMSLFIFFIVLAIPFAVFKEKAAKFVSGFKSLSQEQQAQYDKACISRNMRNQCLLWAFIMFIGAVLSYYVTPYCAIVAFIVWLVFFFKEVQLDAEMTFEKYKIK